MFDHNNENMQQISFLLRKTDYRKREIRMKNSRIFFTVVIIAFYPVLKYGITFYSKIVDKIVYFGSLVLFTMISYCRLRSKIKEYHNYEF